MLDESFEKALDELLVAKKPSDSFINREEMDVYKMELDSKGLTGIPDVTFLEKNTLEANESTLPGKKLLEPDNFYLERNNMKPGSLCIESKTQNFDTLEQNEKRTNLEYSISKKLANQHIIRCCNKRVFVYNNKFGCFNELSESELYIFIRDNMPDEVDKRLNKNKMSEIVHRIETNPDLQVNFESFNKFTHLINYRNCVYDTTTETIRPNSPDYLFTHYVHADYERLKVVPPYAEGSNAGVFAQFLEDCTQGDQQKIKSLQELTGYIISNYSNAKKFFILIGEAHTGKSVWLGIWRALIGIKHTTAVTLKQLGNNRFMTAELFNSRLNISPEMNEEGGLKGIDVIKALTGGDLISAERKGKDPFYFYGKTKLVAAGNHMPDMDKPDITSAFTDRMMFIVFNQSIPEEKRDKNLLDKLLNETKTIINWAMEGLQRLKQQNFIFNESNDAKRFKAQYISQMSITDFIEAECEIDLNNPDYKVHRKDLYQAYLKHSRENQTRVLKDKDFFQLINKLGVTSSKIRINGSTPLQGFRGVTLKRIN